MLINSVLSNLITCICMVHEVLHEVNVSPAGNSMLVDGVFFPTLVCAFVEF